jgi:hypothetical protein
MKRKIAGMLAASAMVAAIGATSAVADPVGTSDSKSCHGYDISTFAREFGGVAAVAQSGEGFTVQTAQKADQTYCKTGVLLPPPA